MNFGKAIWLGSCVINGADGATTGATGWRKGIITNSVRLGAGQYRIDFNTPISLSDCSLKVCAQGGTNEVYPAILLASDGLSAEINTPSMGSTGGADRTVYVEILRVFFP